MKLTYESALGVSPCQFTATRCASHPPITREAGRIGYRSDDQSGKIEKLTVEIARTERIADISECNLDRVPANFVLQIRAVGEGCHRSRSCEHIRAVCCAEVRVVVVEGSALAIQNTGLGHERQSAECYN